ncbi:hypothetical protein KAT92_04160 [Candidatus Babeliales bacterium]|nr:hypothetical protein [Candidatus Babeliales bacterium]
MLRCRRDRLRNKRLLLFSFLFHVAVVLVVAYFQSDTAITKPFLVLGAHSKQPTHAYFRSQKAPSQLSYNGYLKARRAADNKWLAARAARQKKAQAKKLAKKPVTKVAKKINPIVKKPVKKQAKKLALKKQVPVKQKEEKPPKLEELLDADELPVVDDQEWLNFNLMGESDPRMIAFQQSIQKEVARVWRPPLGVGKGTECVGKFVINKKGAVENFELVTRSTVLIYDLSIVRVANDFQFDECLWGKTFVITFRQ